MNRKRVLAIAAGLVVVLGVGTLGALLGQRWATQQGVPRPAATAGSPSPPSPSPPPSGFTTFRSQQAGFALAYPASWTRFQHTDPNVVLVAARNPGNSAPRARAPQDSMLVRVVPLDTPIGRQELPAAKKLTDRIVTSGKSMRLRAKPQQITMAGLPGYFYFYTFKDPASGKTGVHSHYFLFKKRTMIVLVFQALPKEQFPRLAPTFDRITGTFHVLNK